MPNETYDQVGETPLERAARMEAAAATSAAQDRQEEQEADIVVGDIGDYVTRTDPASLPEAEQALNDWEIPINPLDGVPDDVALMPGVEGEPLVAIFAAQTESEANIVRGLLEASGIPVALDGLPSPIMGSVFQAGETRWGDLLVPASLADQARNVIAEATRPETAF